MRVKRREKERKRSKRSRPFLLRELYLRTQASIYNVPLARVVSKKSITQQHTRESCIRSPHGPPNLARSPLFPTIEAVPRTHALSRRPSFLECHPPPPVRLPYLFYTARALYDRFRAPGWNSLSSRSPSVVLPSIASAETRSRLNRSDIERHFRKIYYASFDFVWFISWFPCFNSYER